MIVREIDNRGGVRTERLVDYSTGKVVTELLRPRAADAWVNHWSLSMGARTDEHAAEIAGKCARAKVPCEFDSMLRLKVNSASHQKKLANAIFGKGKVRNLNAYY